MQQEELLIVDQLSLGFPDAPDVVDMVSFSLSPGETLGLIGRSGSGKSMIAHAIAGLLPRQIEHRNGSIRFGTIEKGRRKYSMIFQEPQQALNPTIRCGRQLLHALKVYYPQLSSNERKAKALEWMEKVRLPDPARIFRAYPHELSGGQQQRLLIAIAMSAKPALLIADEPTTALDTVTELEVLKLLQELSREEGTALLFISHDLAVVRYLADNLVVLQQGKIVAQGKTEALIAAPPNDIVKSLVNNSARLKLGVSSVHELDAQERPIQLSVKELHYAYGLKTNWLGTTTKKLFAVRGVDLDIRKGEFLAIVGESGCGKSTLARCINGLLPNYEGSIENADKRKAAVQTVFQDPAASLNPSMNARQSVGEVLTLYAPDLNHAELKDELAVMFDSVGLPLEVFSDRYPEELSGGQKQRIAIARALAARPTTLICDEAVSALDAELQIEIMKLLRQRCDHDGLSILFISHDLALVLEYADRICVMDKGKIVEEASPHELRKGGKHPQTQLLLEAASLQS